MSAARVHRLRLTASHDDDVRRGAILIGDALRVATLPEARGARHYVVRRLDVGRFARDAAPQTIALAIEQRMAGLIARAVDAGAPGAGAAEAVWFADEVEAIAALAERVVAGPPPVEWFWRRIARGALARPSVGEVIAACLDAAADRAVGAVAVAVVVDRVERARPGRVLGELTVARAAGWIARMFGGGVAAGGVERAPDASGVIARLAPAWRARIAAWLPRWGGDARAVWLVAIAMIAAGAAPASPQRVVARAQAVVAELVARAREREEQAAAIEIATATPTPTPPMPPMPEALPIERIDRAPGSRVVNDAVDDPVNEVVSTATTDAPEPAAIAETAPATATPLAVPAPRPRARTAAAAAVFDELTEVGGLLLLIRPLVALDLPGWIDRHTWAADSAFPARLLAGIARGCGATDDDPLVTSLTSLDAALDPALDRPHRRIAWERALARWLHAANHLSLAAVVRRPGRVTCTPTHIDLGFPARTAELAIRIAGLDVDPGWVPWLGRAIRFHYIDGDPS